MGEWGRKEQQVTCDRSSYGGKGVNEVAVQTVASLKETNQALTQLDETA
ncbi:hypothetical protein H6S82_12145 [Planktothrix sp. FACHB-1355]|nr:hypothetical protein [Planktothrix sp. FACHB-1355]